MSSIDYSQLVTLYTDTTSATTTTSSDELGKDEFLQLLVTQLQNQDPLDPVKNEEFVAQLAQFSSLEQMIALNTNFSDMLLVQQLGQATSLIGKTVTYYDADGNTQTGTVDAVGVYSDGPSLIVNDTEIIMDQLYSISSAVSSDSSESATDSSETTTS